MSVQRVVDRNPFPRKTVVTESIDRVPTYPSIAFKEAETKLLEAARRFGTEHNWPGAAIGLRGGFGSGKTHTCLWLIQSFKQQQPMCKTIYAKVQTANRLDLYRNYIGQNLNPEDFQRLISAHILVVLRQRGAVSPTDQTLSSMAEKELRERIEKEPELGIEFAREDLLPVTDLLRTLQSDAEESARTLAADFSAAYSRIAHPLTGKLAIQWLQGNTLPLGEMRDLGVTLPGIATPEQAWLAFRFLLAAYARAELPFVLCIDEHERVTIRSTDEDRKASWGLLKDLAEAFVGSGHILIVSGVAEAWDTLPDDVYARIRREDIVEIGLEHSEAPKLLRAYAPDLDKIFSSEALQRLFDVSQNNNARRLLDLAHQAWKVWASGPRRPLGPEAIRDVTRSALGDRNRKVSLAEAIEGCARALGLLVEKNVEFRGARFDFVLSSTEQRRRILVQVSESAFLLDEIDHGREIIDAQKQLAEEHDRIRTCAIMIGYSSFEVRDALERVVDRVIAYEEAKFRGQFEDFVLRALKDMSADVPPVPVPQIVDATRILDVTEAARSAHVEGVQFALEEASAAQRERQEGSFSRQADEQMATVVQDLESNLLQESELLIRLSMSKEKTTDASETTLHAIGYINAQYDALRRARMLVDREGVGTLMEELLEAYRRVTARAESAWQGLIDSRGDVNIGVGDLVRERVARRRALLHEIEGTWQHRKQRTSFAAANLVMVAPLAFAVFLLTWLGVDYWQSWRARQEALNALRQAVAGFITFAAGDPAADGGPKDFATRSVKFQVALSNPALPEYLPTYDLAQVINRVRDQYKKAPIPSEETVASLREASSLALRRTYRETGGFLWEYGNSHRAVLIAVALLIAWSAGWQYLRHWWIRRQTKW